MIYTRKELAELLNTSTNSIKKMDQRNTLEDNLKKHGYTLINKTKKGKNITSLPFISCIHLPKLYVYEQLLICVFFLHLVFRIFHVF